MLRGRAGFTLAELLITLYILGVLATFTIPKVINASQSSQANAAAKDAIGMLAGAFQTYQMTGNFSQNTTMGAMTQYMNYVSVATSGSIDDIPGFGSTSCSSTSPCMKLHTGAVMRYSTSSSFGGTGANNGLMVFIDPDGVYGNSTQGNSKSVRIALMYSGRITSIGQSSGVSSSNDGIGAGFSDPSWFSW